MTRLAPLLLLSLASCQALLAVDRESEKPTAADGGNDAAAEAVAPSGDASFDVVDAADDRDRDCFAPTEVTFDDGLLFPGWQTSGPPMLVDAGAASPPYAAKFEVPALGQAQADFTVVPPAGCRLTSLDVRLRLNDLSTTSGMIALQLLFKTGEKTVASAQLLLNAMTSTLGMNANRSYSESVGFDGNGYRTLFIHVPFGTNGVDEEASFGNGTQNKTMLVNIAPPDVAVVQIGAVTQGNDFARVLLVDDVLITPK